MRVVNFCGIYWKSTARAYKTMFSIAFRIAEDAWRPRSADCCMKSARIAEQALDRARRVKEEALPP